jgi:prepilin-type N-terminal cleavage/methylation domain-containing protein
MFFCKNLFAGRMRVNEPYSAVAGHWKSTDYQACREVAEELGRVVIRPVSNRQSGFTLVEVAIVLVIIGLILGGVFKGQALVDNARVRAMSTEIDGIRTALLAFQERYRSIPGDFPNAPIQIDSATLAGNGNGRIDDPAERAGVWQQLSMAGFIDGNFDGAQASAGSSTDVECGPDTCPQNPYSGYYKVSYSAQAADADNPANEIFTGSQIPVNILSQLDTRLDDGMADSGRFRVHRSFASSCTNNGDWDLAGDNTNCAAVLRE